MRRPWLLGGAVAIAAFALDQAHKYWMLHVYGIEGRGRVSVAPFLDLVMAWNKGVSYGLFPADSDAGRYALIGFAALAGALLTVWMARASSRLLAASLGLIIGGALGNAVDRVLYGAVADFFSFHVGSFYWYVFNIADVAITIGAAGLLLDWLRDIKKSQNPANRLS